MTPTSDGRIDQVISEYGESTLLRLSTAGSVDDGKSTLIGRLLHDTKNVHEDTLDSVKSASKNRDNGEVDFSLITDGLKSEREQGITIDVAYRYFSTPKRKFILADTPGHVQYTRNMATGASNSDVAMILIDARKGILPQTKRHSFICSLLGVKHFIIAVNKMDLVDYSEAVYEEIKIKYEAFAQKLPEITDIRFLPMSALKGDNVCFPSENMPWHTGRTLLSYLENVYVEGDRNFVDFRFPVQYVVRQSNEKRFYSGQVLSGTIRVGDTVLALPSGKQSRVLAIHGDNGSEKAFTPMSVGIALEDEIDIGRGDMLVRPQDQPHMSSKVEAMLVWMQEAPLDLSKKYKIQHTTRVVKAAVNSLKYQIDVNTLSQNYPTELRLNEIGRVEMELQSPIMWDVYSTNRYTGSFIVIDPETNGTAACGMIINPLPGQAGGKSKDGSNSSNPEGLIVLSEEKSSSFEKLTDMLTERSIPWTVISRELLAQGLNSDLKGNTKNEKEFCRRMSEVAILMKNSGLVVFIESIGAIPTLESYLPKNDFVNLRSGNFALEDLEGILERIRN